MIALGIGCFVVAVLVTGACAFWLGYNKGAQDADTLRREAQNWYLLRALSTDERHGAMQAFDYVDSWLP